MSVYHVFCSVLSICMLLSVFSFIQSIFGLIHHLTLFLTELKLIFIDKYAGISNVFTVNLPRV